MIIVNGKQIIDIQHKNESLKNSVCNYLELFKQYLEFIGAQEINTGDSSFYSLNINKKNYSNINIINNNGYIEGNKVFFNKSGNTTIQLGYKHLNLDVDVNVKDIVVDLIDYNSEYFTLHMLGDGNMTLNLPSSYTKAPSYSLNGGAWITFTSNTTVSLNAGDKVRVKCVTGAYQMRGLTMFNSTCEYKVYGNVMSLLYGDEFEAQSKLTTQKSFQGLFYNQTTLKNIENLILPATTLAEGCYNYMFYGCTSLTSAPELIATTLTEDCYAHMFRGCTSLITAPKLPATTLADYCYQSMFMDCTSLTKAPQLPATTLVSSCYSAMFDGCTSLTEAPELPATILAGSCYHAMFNGCTSLTEAPELPATKLVFFCYGGMFKGCSKLNYIKMLATDVSGFGSLTNWVSGVASGGTFIKHKNITSLPTGSSGIPEGWTVEDYVEINLITFTIDGNEYLAEEGMTWRDWTNSEYNTDGFYCAGLGEIPVSGPEGDDWYITKENIFIDVLSSAVMGTHEIIDGCSYHKIQYNYGETNLITF